MTYTIEEMAEQSYTTYWEGSRPAALDWDFLPTESRDNWERAVRKVVTMVLENWHANGYVHPVTDSTGKPLGMVAYEAWMQTSHTESATPWADLSSSTRKCWEATAVQSCQAFLSRYDNKIPSYETMTYTIPSWEEFRSRVATQPGKSLGEIAHDAYSETHNIVLCNPWIHLSDIQKEAWENAAFAAGKTFAERGKVLSRTSYESFTGDVRQGDLLSDVADSSDMVNHPAHYNNPKFPCECIDVVETMSFNLGNVIKYVWRADEKGSPLVDLEKARWYLDREISRRRRETE